MEAFTDGQTPVCERLHKGLSHIVGMDVMVLVAVVVRTRVGSGSMQWKAK